MKRLLVAPDSLGGWLSAVEFCERVRAGFRELDGVELLFHPMADGGEGTGSAVPLGRLDPETFGEWPLG